MLDVFLSKDDKSVLHRSLMNAKSQMYEAQFRANKINHPMAERVSEAFRYCERLFLDVIQLEKNRIQKIDDDLTAEYGPEINVKWGDR